MRDPEGGWGWGDGSGTGMQTGERDVDGWKDVTQRESTTKAAAAANLSDSFSVIFNFFIFRSLFAST